MKPWDCCRTCLSKDSLSPIFPSNIHGNNYSEVILTTTGLKVQMNDSLPQEICTTCVNSINEYFTFRKYCYKTERTLLGLLKQQPVQSMKETANDIRDSTKEKQPSSKESSFNKQEDENVFDDNTDLDYGLNKDSMLKDDSVKDYIVFESTVEEILKKHIRIEFENLPSEKVNKKNVKLKTKTKKKYKNKKLEVKVETCYDDVYDYGIEDDIPLNKVFEETVTEKKVENVLKPYECEFCHKIYKNKLSYQSHTKIHTGRKIICEHCGKQFLDRRRLLMHCKAKHGYLKTDKCAYCDYTGISAESVKIHERLHTGEKPFVCEVCSASFHRKSSYLQHHPIHLPDKTVPCDLCPLLFKSRTLMRIHRSRHAPRAHKHRCLVCGGCFGKRWHALRHLRRVHGLNAAPAQLEKVPVAQE